MAVSIFKFGHAKKEFFSAFFSKINQYNQDIIEAFSDILNGCDYSSEELLRLHKLFLDIRGYASRAWRVRQQNSVRSCLEDILSFLRSLKLEKSCGSKEWQTTYRVDEIEIKQFRKSLEKRLAELERSWIFAPFGIIFHAGMDSDFKNSVIRKVMAGLSISTIIALLLLISAITIRFVGLRNIRTNELETYEELHDFALKSLRFKILIQNKIKYKSDIQLSALEGNESIQGNVNDQENRRQVQQNRISEINSAINSNFETHLEPSYALITGQFPPSKNENRHNGSSRKDYSQKLNSVMARVRKDKKDSQLTMANIFAFHDDETTYEEITLSVQVAHELVDAIHDQLSIINSNYFFEEDGVDDDLSIILFVAAIGVLGSVTSILIRVQDIDQDTRFVGSNLDGSAPTEEIDPLKPVLGGLFRPFIGAFSSLFIFAAIKSGIVTLSFLSAGNAFYFFTVVSFVSGFSERLFVSVITKATNSFDVSEPEPKGQKLSTVMGEDIELALQSKATQDTTSLKENSEEGSFLQEKNKESKS